MRYGEFKDRIQFLLAGDTSLAKNSLAIDTIYKDAMNYILTNSEPLGLISRDTERFRPYRWVNSRYFIRESLFPEDDNQPLDIDIRLQDALLRVAAAYMVRSANDLQRKSIFENEAAVILDQYAFEKEQFLASVGYHRSYSEDSLDDRKDLDILLEHWGHKRYYTPIRKRAGYDYNWNYRVFELLDRYMQSDEEIILSNSEINLWDMFCEYQMLPAGEILPNSDELPSNMPDETSALKAFDSMYLALFE